MKLNKTGIFFIIVLIFAFANIIRIDAAVNESADSISTKQEALSFLKKNMFQADILAAKSGLLDSIADWSMQARNEMSWGKNIPEREFKYFVLTPRVNNEALDASRGLFYKELKDRVNHLSMYDAILEVNHWAHEKATYQPSDARTSTPLSTVSQAIGRCGEESTLLVAALRAVGIPARQVYTPRWAHTDDNHAWVEAWADGTWYFLGACEPEPVLNLAWFNAPASRGMLMHTNIFSPNYDGPEEVLKRTALTTTINVTSNYAPTRNVVVTVIDDNGNPIENASVQFCIYNYSEFYPAVVTNTDSNGQAKIICGEGDLVVWATNGSEYYFQPIDKTQNELLITLSCTDPAKEYQFDIHPPKGNPTLPTVSDEAILINEKRKQQEDSIRKEYTNTFLSSEEAKQFANHIGMDADILSKILVESRGNHAAICKFLESSDSEKKEKALKVLNVISEKDRRDISIDVLEDACTASVDLEDPLMVEYVLNPRIELEHLIPWRQKILAWLPANRIEEFRNNPQTLAAYVAEKIKEDNNTTNTLGVKSSPAATLQAEKTDTKSRNIFFVAAARSCNIPARIDAVTGKTQYCDNRGNFIDVELSPTYTADISPKGKLNLIIKDDIRNHEAKYYYNFSISKIINGLPVLLEFDDVPTADQWNEKYNTLDPGQYILTSGQRLADGSVLVKSTIIDILPAQTTNIEFDIRKDDSQVQVIGGFNSENLYRDINLNVEKSILSTTGRGFYVLAIIRGSHEPSAHLLNELTELKNEVEATGRKFVLLFSNEKEAGIFNKQRYDSLPQNVVLGIDVNNVADQIADNLHLNSNDTPLLIIADTFNRIVFASSGYNIGLASKVIDTLKRVE